ncbi:MAG: glycosyltransferase [Lachnospiraceae bacterium]|nr:glycosyltransferase [Lachnospiraceae bacterium]
MKILHYSLGFPPYRTGGLTKFCMDLMNEQVSKGHKVALLWPGQFKVIDRKVKIIERKSVGEIQSFEIINPLPVSYDEGIKNVNAYMQPCEDSAFMKFLFKYNADVIHIHTFMGLHQEFLRAAKKLGVRIVFSVHDYFTICPKVTLYKNGDVCRTSEKCEECVICNKTALSIKKIYLLQSSLYRIIKDSSAVKRIRKNHRNDFFNDQNKTKGTLLEHDIQSGMSYIRLRQYYAKCLDKIDFVHYNSKNTKMIFEHFFNVHDSKAITISHSGIKDQKRIKKFSPYFRFTYLGPQGGAKGFFLLQSALDKMWNDTHGFELNIYFQPDCPSPYMKIHDRYDYSELSNVMDRTDLLIVPSIWYETFGYTVLEALSYGVPVLITNRVGAKDILPPGAGIILDDISPTGLYNCLLNISMEELIKMNKIIVDEVQIKTMEKMADEIFNECYFGRQQ